MARSVRDANLETRTARGRLESRAQPYWRSIEVGLHLGYRRVKVGGTWLARRFIGERRYSQTVLGSSDDLQDPDGETILSYREAIEAARKWWRSEQRRELGLGEETTKGPFKVSDCLEDYFKHREARGSKGVGSDRSYARTRIIPQLGDVEVAKLTSARLRRWHTDLATAPKLVRVKRGTENRPTRAIDKGDPEAVRKRRSSANRILTVLKAALNHAFTEGRATSDEAWRRVKPFREADAPVVRFLTEEEITRLLNACSAEFRELVRGALATGCRYGELIRMKVSDFQPSSGTVAIRTSKAGKPRHVVLTEEGSALFSRLCAGRKGTDLIFNHDDGRPWAASHQLRPIEEASERAGIDPPATFHILRHTHASLLVQRGVALPVIASQLGHADLRITMRNYAHLAPSTVADAIRGAMPTLGIAGENNVRKLKGRAHRG